MVGGNLFQNKKGFCSDQRFAAFHHPYWNNDPEKPRAWITMQVYLGLNIHPSHSELPTTLTVTQASRAVHPLGWRDAPKGEKSICFPSPHGKCIISAFCSSLNSRLRYISCYPVGLHSVLYNFQINLGNMILRIEFSLFYFCADMVLIQP